MQSPHPFNCPTAETSNLPPCPANTLENHLCSTSCYQPWLQHFLNCQQCVIHIQACKSTKCLGFMELWDKFLVIKNLANSINQGPKEKFPRDFWIKVESLYQLDYHGLTYDPSPELNLPEEQYYIVSHLGSLTALRHQPNENQPYLPENTDLVVDYLSRDDAIKLCPDNIPLPRTTPHQRKVEQTILIFKLLEFFDRLPELFKKHNISFDFMDYLDWIKLFCHQD